MQERVKMQENFRKQAMGFNKKDVIDYIYQLNLEKDTNEKEAAEQIEALTAERDKLRAENEILLKTREELEEKNKQLEAEVADAEIQRSRLFEEINESRRIMLDNEREFNIKNEQIAKLISENEAYAEECKKYAEISKDVGKTIMEAKSMAADIVSKAQLEAAEIRRATEAGAIAMLGEVRVAQSEVETLKRNLADMTRACENRIKTVELNLDSVVKVVSGLSDEGAVVEAPAVESAAQAVENSGEDTSEHSNVEFF